MASSSDKARFHLEQQVPELQDLLRKKIFTEPQVKSIAQKRSSFEHILNARDSTPQDYARYSEYEQNLESLRKRRCQKLGIKPGGHAGQRRIFFILDRGVRKFPGDLKLWMLYLAFCRKEKATKKIKEVLTRLLRLHPTRSELWIWAARYAYDEEGDMTGARGYMQRGLRFCELDRAPWIEYARLECLYIAKVATRRRILGMDGQGLDVVEEEEGEDLMKLPQITEDDINPRQGGAGMDENAARNLENTPALTGAIPIAIFDAAAEKFNHNAKLGQEFFEMVSEFDHTPAFDRILNHMLSSMLSHSPNAVETVSCHMRIPLLALSPDCPEFPNAIGQSLRTVRESMARLPLLKREIAQDAIQLLLPYALDDCIDPDIQTVLSASVRQYVKEIGSGDRVADLVQKLVQAEKRNEARRLAETGLRVDDTNARLLQAHDALNAVVSAS